MTAKQLESVEVDEFVDLDTELYPLKSKISRHQFLRKKIAARFENREADGTFKAEGVRTDGVLVGPKTMQRDFKPGALKRLADFLETSFWKIAKVSMKDFDDHVTIDERDRFVVRSQSGFRLVTVVRTESVDKAA